MSLLEPNEGDPGMIKQLISRPNERNTASFEQLLSVLNASSSDMFCSHLASTLKPLASRSIEKKSKFPVGAGRRREEGVERVGGNRKSVDVCVRYPPFCV